MSLFKFSQLNSEPQLQQIQREIEDRFNQSSDESSNAYSVIYIDDTDPQVIAVTAATRAKLTGWTVQFKNRVEVQNDRIKFGHSANVMLNVSFSFTHSVNNTICEMWIYRNGQEIVECEVHRKVGTAGDIGAASLTSFLPGVNADDYFELYTECNKSGNLTIQNGNFNIVEI